MEINFSQVFNALPGIIWTTLASGHVDFFNQRWFDYTGLSAADSYELGWQAVIHPEDLPKALARWEAIRASGAQGEMQARLRRFDGEYRLFLMRVRPMPAAGGEVARWCGMSTDIEDQRQAEEARRAQWWMSPETREAHFRSVADSIPALVALVAASDSVETVNQASIEYFGMTAEQMRDGVMQRELIHPDDRARVVALTTGRAADDGELFDYESRLRRADGVYRWFQVRAFPLFDAEGRVVLRYFLHTDIDDRKRAEALLAGEKRVLEMAAGGQPMPAVLTAICQLFESLGGRRRCAVLLLEPRGPTLAIGAAPSLPAPFLTGVVGKPFTAKTSPSCTAVLEKRQIIAADLALEARWPVWTEHARAAGLSACWATPFVSSEGRVLGCFTVYGETPGSPAADDQGFIERFTQIASIAIERAHKDAALKRSEAFLREAQRLSLTGSFHWRVAPNKVVWSDEVYRITGVQPGTPVTRDVGDRQVHPEDRQAMYEKIEQALKDGTDFELEYRLLLPDQSIKYIHNVFHRTQDEDGELSYVGAMQDITQRRRSEEALSQGRAELAHVARIASLSAVTASIAHEINQPLAGIVTNANTCLRMLSAKPPNIEGALQTARRTIRDASRAGEVVTRLRALFTRAGSAGEAVDLNEAAREVVSLAWNELQRSRTVLQIDYAADLPPVGGGRVQLQQVILNLLANAADAMATVEDRPRLIVIRTARDGQDQVRLSVRDAGVGFEPAQGEKLFEAFYSTKENGMGIGLSISRTIIESYRGRLWAEPNEGPGATFCFSLPAMPAATG